MKVSKSLFLLFLACFFAFSLSFMSFQNTTMTHEEGGSRFWMMRIILLLDAVCVGVLVSNIKQKYKGIHLVCLLWLLVMPVIMFLNHNPIADTVRTILWPLLFETTYLCCRNWISRAATIKRLFYIIAIVGAGYFLATRIGAIHQTNTIYFCLLPLPWLLFNTDKKTTIILLLLFSAFVLLGMKRSTMLVMVLMWGFYFLYGMKSKRGKLYTIVVSVVLIAGVFILFERIDDYTGGVLTERVNKEETDEGKGREAIWAITISMIRESSPAKLLTGHGHFGVRQDSWLEISAHNDFLEVIYDYGLIIFFLYLCLWYYVLRRAYSLYRAQSPLFIPYSSSLSIFLAMSVVSHLILYTTYFNYLVMFWGMIEAIIEMDKKQKLIKKKITR